jgi:hypothetical protein
MENVPNYYAEQHYPWTQKLLNYRCQSKSINKYIQNRLELRTRTMNEY